MSNEHVWIEYFDLFIDLHAISIPEDRDFGSNDTLSGEWVIAVKGQVGNFSAISWSEQVTFPWDYDVSFALDQHA